MRKVTLGFGDDSSKLRMLNMLGDRWALSEERRRASSGRIARLHGSPPYEKSSLEVRFQNNHFRTSSLSPLSAFSVHSILQCLLKLCLYMCWRRVVCSGLQCLFAT
jgi:hypothetical protein